MTFLNDVFVAGGIPNSTLQRCRLCGELVKKEDLIKHLKEVHRIVEPELLEGIESSQEPPQKKRKVHHVEEDSDSDVVLVDEKTYEGPDAYPVKEYALESMNFNLSKSILHRFSVKEREQRIQLAACYRLFEDLGWTDTIYGHLTCKVKASGKESFLINPFGLLYDEITASSLVKVDLGGEIVDGGVTPFGINQAGYVIHSAIHEARPDPEGCVMHSHHPDAVAVSCDERGLFKMSQTSHILGKISYHDYRGIVVDLNEKKILQEEFKEGNIMILKNHGVVTYGKNIAEAFMYMYTFIEACKFQTRIPSRDHVKKPDQSVIDKSYHISHTINKEGFGLRELSAFMRRLDRKDDSYRN